PFVSHQGMHRKKFFFLIYFPIVFCSHPLFPSFFPYCSQNGGECCIPLFHLVKVVFQFSWRESCLIEKCA
ncbi:hypothetical protein VIGAN_02125300, partial [Vigna angularis var. angularis]